MKMPLLLVWEHDGRLVHILRPFAEFHRWSLREVRRLEEVLDALPRGRPGVLILRVGRNLEEEFGGLDRVTWLLPEADVVVVLDTDEPRLTGLAWDLGARCVLSFSRHRDDLAEVVVGLLQQESTNAADAR